MKFRLLHLFFLFIFPITVQSQIVNIEAQRIQTDTTGWAGSMGGSFNWTKSVDEVFAANASAHLQYKTNKNLYLLLFDYSFLKGAEQKFVDNTFLHFRINHKFTELLRGELFTQLQTNKITRIDTRFLIGAGPRFKIPAAKNIKVYLGVLFMYEYEKELVEPERYNRDFRNSSYLSFTYKPNEFLELTSTTFYQPRLDYFSDFRITNQETVTLSITKKLSATLNWNYLYDAFPVEGVPNSYVTFSTGFKFQFNP